MVRLFYWNLNTRNVQWSKTNAAGGR